MSDDKNTVVQELEHAGPSQADAEKMAIKLPARAIYTLIYKCRHKTNSRIVGHAQNLKLEAYYCRAATIVQSRAFRMEKINHMTGEMSEETDVFLIPGIDMINHHCLPHCRHTALHASTDTTTAVVDGKPVTVKGCFTLVAGVITFLYQPRLGCDCH